MPYTVIIPEKTKSSKAIEYLHRLRNGETKAGRYLSLATDNQFENLTLDDFWYLLINTKTPQIFAENDVKADGSDWNHTELKLLGDVSIALPVTIFYNGDHYCPVVHSKPFQGHLLYTPGALLCCAGPSMPVDLAEVSNENGDWNEAGYQQLYQRRLVPVFDFVNNIAKRSNRPALITIPGLGCGQFAGKYRGKLGTELQIALQRILNIHAADWPFIHTIYFDPYSECENLESKHGHIRFRVRPLLKGNSGKCQLSKRKFLKSQTMTFRSMNFLVSLPGIMCHGPETIFGQQAELPMMA